ncbi:MAG: DUF58 domain-containing protein [Azoarcus sp.]|jgi:uncharacterized protein (DUF58 family)|nr:DUF58 domain-containing protein [Azoarcus sp.]
MRSFLRPTVTGIIWFLAALALLATAINYGNNLVFALAFMLLSLWISAAWECWRNLAGLEWRAAPIPPVFAGDALCPCGKLRDPAGRRRERIALGQGRRAGEAADLDGDGLHLELALPGLPRGQRTVTGLCLFSVHPLGLWRTSRLLPPGVALIYPRPAGDKPLPGKTPRPAHRQQESGDFQGVRAYAPGDPPRRVNWRLYARREELAVNAFDGGQGGHALWLDMDACDGDLETRLSQLCQWIVTAERQGLEYGLRLPGQGQPPGRGREHQQRCLEALAVQGTEARGTDDERQETARHA